MSRRVSVREVAAAAGVSIGTVSRALNNSGYVSAEVRARVQRAAAELDYQPDFTARHLRGGRSRTIGYLLPNIANPYLAMHLSEVERLAQAAGYSLLVGSSERPERDRELVAFFESRRLEGLIASPSTEYSQAPQSSPFATTQLPSVIVDRDLGADFDSVLVDHCGGIVQVMEYLISLGHRRVALFASGRGIRPGREKLRGYMQALGAAGLAFDERLIYIGDSWLESSRARMQDMLSIEAPPTAVIAVGTQLLSGAANAIREHGLDIPTDVSVVGIGTLETLELMYPPVTALRVNYLQSAAAAVRLVIERIEQRAPAQRRSVLIPSDLILGRSCAPRR